MTYRPNEVVHSRFFPYEALTVISCNGCIAEVRDSETGETYPVAVGCITRADAPPASPKLEPYISTASRQFGPGNFVTTWNAEIGRNAVGVTRAIADVTEANPMVLVKWMHDLSEEWVRSEYLYLERA